MIPLTKEEKKIHREQKVCYICKKGSSADDDNKKYYKVRDNCHYTGKYRGAAHNICNLRYKIPKEIPVVFHNGSIYDYHIIIKGLAEEFEGQFECLGKIQKNVLLFQCQLKKNLTIKLEKVKFIDSFRFMSSSLSNLVDNLSEDFIVVSAQFVNLDFTIFKDDQLIFRCFECKNNYNKEFNKKLVKRFANIYEFCNKDINKSILLLRKAVYLYEYMDSWERFHGTSLTDKEAFYSSLNMEDITDADHRHAKKVFENFRNKCIERYELDPAHLLSASGLAWQVCLKKTEVKLELTENDM